MSAGRVLVLNAGSSSLKASLIELPRTTAASVEAEWGPDGPSPSDRRATIAAALRGLEAGTSRRATDAVGYRVVHGGDRFTAPVVIDESVLADIDAARRLAPLHNGVALETIEAGRALIPAARHVACFDTAFHATLAPQAYRYPIPEHWYRDWGMRRYGFHGLSVAWASQQASELLRRSPRSLSLVVAHLGSGASVTAVQGGRSVNTSMGLTPLEGLMMGTRSGSIDPGVLLHVVRSGLADADEVAEALEHASGLAGVSGISADMRTLEEAAAAGHEGAALAISMFVERAAAWIAAMATALSRLDGLVFTGGIGEHSDAVRRRIVARLGIIGVAPLPHRDEAIAASSDDAVLSGMQQSIPVMRVTAREDLVIAAQVADLLAI